jgi:RsiW-degrading membrane proteinase PrsW (M82 family)
MGGPGNIKARHIYIAFGLGALAGFIVSWGELGLLFSSAPLFGVYLFIEPTALVILMAVIIAPLVEELAKPLGLYLIQGEEKPAFKVEEWALLGAIGGLGFAVLENIMYSVTVIGFGWETSLTLLLLRFLLPLHMMTSAVAGFGFGLWVKNRNGLYFVICLIIAMVLHGLFNLAAVFVG